MYMKNENQDLLFERYKSLFALRDSNPSVPISFGGIRCGDGWFSIIDELLGKINTIGNDGIRVVQIKNKLGALRIYFSSDTNDDLSHIRALVSDYVLKSCHTCEMCGLETAKGRNVKGWMTPLCDIHFREAMSD